MEISELIGIVLHGAQRATRNTNLVTRNAFRATRNSKLRRYTTMSDWEPKIAAFLCNWCSYGAADLAGVGRMEYPANIRVIRIPCTGRMDPKFFLAAMREGADGVWVSG
jgi:F420-non-reducing hydrogenase iron-sulfur subunit